MGYEIILCRVESVDTVARSVKLRPQTPTYFNTIEVKAGSGLKFASSYAPYTRVVDPDDGKVFSTPVGFVNYPQQGDLVLAAIWITDMSRRDRLRAKLSQNQNMEVIIFAKISWDFPHIGTHDNILGDRSGAKIHFNHGWLDTKNFSKDAEGDKSIHLSTGHLTTVANRMVRISGRKFLPFGLHSHKLGLTGLKPTGATTAAKMRFLRDNSKIINETGGEPVGWAQAFTKDPTRTDIYDDLPSLSKRGSKKFLEPPCPEPGAMMDMHESGYKLLVETSGHVRTYVPKGGIEVIGHNSNDMHKMSFDPEGESESSSFPEVADGVKEFHLKGGSKTIKMEMNAPQNKVVFTMDGGLIFTIDGANNKVTISAGGGFEFTGNLKVTGSIEATTTVKAGTKVITPAVSDS